jgi:hypothetical protein
MHCGHVRFTFVTELTYTEPECALAASGTSELSSEFAALGTGASRNRPRDSRTRPRELLLIVRRPHASHTRSSCHSGSRPPQTRLARALQNPLSFTRTVSTRHLEAPMFSPDHSSLAYWIARVCVLSLLAAVGCAGQVEPESAAPELALANEALATCPPKIPPELAIPEGNRLAFTFGASGVQRYVCPADGSKWTFVEPEADLFDKHGRPTGHHYKGPTWEALDGSTVVGAQPALASLVVDASSIPWLKLQAASHTGSGRMSNVTFIQRLNTKGGLAPAGTCTPAETRDVNYTATYAFYEAKPAKKH